ncbi:ORF6N domain-containing protein [uncultured Desulfovibrio sp.]|mgnify:CR=1 FL=1|uniref:ORF6N domain-containing protein n=1 Tax=uncultured Desulfovibrio sp. TaxID=167968 RepID=UPI00260D0E6B|nr:ORF6N domain-containing protein [uncultured Desulfovibrio sp.]
MSQAQLLPTASPSASLPPLTYKGLPVVTTEMLAKAYGCAVKNIQMNFANNRERFTEGKHFFVLTNGEVKSFRDCTKSFGSVVPARTRNLTLWLERGAARHAKMLNTDQAWDVFEMLEETFFRVVKPAEQPTTLTPSTAEDRKPLRSLVSAWAQVCGSPHQALWPQVKAHFQLARIDDLPVEWIGDALIFVQGKIDAAGKALPEGKPSHVFKRMGLTPIEELQMGSHIKHMLDGLDMEKIGPRAMECLMLKAKYVSAISEVYRLNRDLVRELGALMHDVNGPAMKAMNKAGCFSDPVADTLYEPRYRLDRINEEYRSAALSALNSNICMAMMLGV